MKMNLSKNWYVRYADIDCGWEEFSSILNESDGWMETDVPCDVHEPLIRNGFIKDPLDGMNCFDSEWVGDKSWWFKKSFQVNSAQLQNDTVELVFESLDVCADIILNGKLAGHQRSSFYPFRKDVKELLKEGENFLLVRLTSGLERVNVGDIEGYNISTEEERRPGRGDARRIFLRKPQFCFGWDWGPKVPTCGIVKDVWLESCQKATIRWVHTFVKTLEPAVKVGFTLEVENFHPYSTLEGCARISLEIEGGNAASCELDLLLRSGMNYIDAEVELNHAKLWWPNGMGEQPLYTVKIEMGIGSGDKTIYPEYQFGIRTVSIDTSKLREGERLFAVTINGVKTFCKGGNWIPADSIYSRITDEKYKILILEAKEANFNMLRIWGGGLYERDVFYEQCDRMGILVWQDFMFACSEYPDDHAEFVNEVELELDYQTKRLRNHPSIALWCGNNENTWGFEDWWENTGYYGAKIYNYIAPATVRKNCPDIPYWNSSPYGGARPNDCEIGDRHHWHDCMMSPEMSKRITPEEYDKVHSKFISEYGYVGPMKRSSIEKYLDGVPFDINGQVWQHHNNTFEKETVVAGINYHYCDPEKLDIDRYLLYAGLCQGLMYAYSLEAFRYQLECNGGLFWMYNDCWGETGWTIIDYYLRRKISFYFVKRALAATKFIMRERNSVINTVGINEHSTEKKVAVEYGYISFDGTVKDINKVSLLLAPHSRETVLTFSKGAFDDKKGVYFVRAIEDEDVPLAMLRTGTYREMDVCPTTVKISAIEHQGENISLVVESSGFAHGVHFNLPDELRLSDDYFEMLPGNQRRITLYNVPDDLDIDAIKVYCINRP